MLQFLSRRTFTHSINTPKSRQSCSLSGAEFHLVSQSPPSAPHRICTLSGLQCLYAKNADMVSTGPSTFVSFDSRTQAGELENYGESSLICSSSTPEGERGRGRENRERERSVEQMPTTGSSAKAPTRRSPNSLELLGESHTSLQYLLSGCVPRKATERKYH